MSVIYHWLNVMVNTIPRTLKENEKSKSAYVLKVLYHPREIFRLLETTNTATTLINETSLINKLNFVYKRACL